MGCCWWFRSPAQSLGHPARTSAPGRTRFGGRCVPLAATPCRRAMQERQPPGKGLLLNLSSNCKCRRRSLASPSKRAFPSEKCRPQRLCKMYTPMARNAASGACLPSSGLHPVYSGLYLKSNLGFLRAFTGKQYRRCGVLRERAWDV